MKHKLLSILLCLAMALSLLPTAALADESVTEVKDEKELRQALYSAPTGTQVTIKLTDNITLEMLYAAPNLPDSTVIQDNEVGDTFNRYKQGVHPTAEDPSHWNSLVTGQTDEQKSAYGAYYHMGANDERIARLVVKADQNVVLDLNGKTIEKNGRATHGDWSNTCTDIIGNYGTLTITDTSTGEKGTIKGHGYISCGGAVLHNYEGATMTVGAVNVDGNAAGMTAGTGQYVIANDGGKTIINGASIYDTATSASLLVITDGEMEVTGNATLNHPATKTINAKGGNVTIENATIISDNDAIYAKGGTTNITGDVTIKASSDDKTAGKLTIAGGAITKAENVSLTAPEGTQWVKNGDVKVLVNTTDVAVVDGKGYATLAAAVAAAKDGDTIKLLKDVDNGDGVIVPSGKNFTLDFDNHTYTVTQNLAGSEGTESQCFQLLKNSTLTFKNGTIKARNVNVAMIIQNYSNLTLEKMLLDGTSITRNDATYTMSNNCGDVVIKDTIINTVPNGVAFDVYGGFGNYSDVTVTVTGSSEINGKIEVARGSGTQNKNTLAINGGTINGELAVTDNEKTEITISGGSFSQPVKEEYCADGFIPKDNGNGTYGVKTGTYAAKIGDTKYESLEVAVSNVTADETITLLQDVPAESVITVARTISFKVDTNKSDGSGVYAFAADTNIIKGNNTTLTTAVESNVYTYSFVYTAPSSSGSSGYYVSTPSKTEHGTVTVSPRYADKGDTVTVTVKPDSGYVLGSLTVTDSKGNELTLTDKGNGKYTFVMPAGKVEVKASFAKEIETSPFADVATDAYYYEAVKWAVGKGITTGVGNDLFAPEQPCTRAQIVTFLWRAAGSPEPKGTASGMTDVVSGSYYEKAVAWAIENGVTTGTTTTTFSPDATCTRAQAVTFLARALSAKASGAAEFSDVPADSYFADAVAWAAANGVTEGIGGGLFGSDNDCTRGQIVTFLYRAYNK